MRAITWNPGPRDNFPSTLPSGTPRFVARRKVFETFDWYSDDVVIGFQELIKKSDQRLRSMFPKLTGFGNGIAARLPHDDDRSGDNLALYWGWDFELLECCLYWSGLIDNFDKGYLRGVKLRRKSTGRVGWFLVVHPPAGKLREKTRYRQLRELLKKAQAGDSKLDMPPVDMRKVTLMGDFNSSKPSSVSGTVRAMARNEFGLRDVKEQLSDANFQGNSWSTKVGGASGYHIDAILTGSLIVPRSARVIRSDIDPDVRGRVLPRKELPGDHRPVEADLLLSPK